MIQTSWFPVNSATSGKGGLGIFLAICAFSGTFGVADAHVQSGMDGDLSYMQPEFIQSFLGGLAAFGVLTSALRLITKAVFDHSSDGLRKGANRSVVGELDEDLDSNLS
ncbi:hypothetical protein V8G54_031067 [Vigna mungo]|uniref:Uncharacterized protein n=1 Tax=Vigna mungo TaxID=3915 RepID=A0AAQ3MXH6_VIGMU